MWPHVQKMPTYPRRRSTSPSVVFVHGDRPPPWRPEAVVARPSSANGLLTQTRCPNSTHTRGSAGQHRLPPSLSEGAITKSLADITHTSLNLRKISPDNGGGQTYPVSPDSATTMRLRVGERLVPQLLDASWEARVVRNSKLMAHQRIQRLELELHGLRRLTAGLNPPAVSRVIAQRIARMESEAVQAESQHKSLEARLKELQLGLTPALRPFIVQLGLAVEWQPSASQRLGVVK